MHTGVVEPGWIDRNGHMNIVHYMRIFDEGCDRFLQTMGIADAANGKGKLTVVAARINIIHRKELLSGESWQLSAGLATVSRKYLTLAHRLMSGKLVHAYCFIRGAVFCVEQRVGKELDDALLLKLKAYIVPGLRDPFEVSAV